MTSCCCRHNEDGSYTYGYESADGTFKIETKLPTGEIKGKYGYVDDTGKVRVVEYGATKYGFEPSGEGITVPTPTLVDDTTDKNGRLLPEYDPEYYEQDPAPAPRPAPRPAARPRPSYSPPQQFSQEPEFEARPAPQRPGVQTTTFDFGPPSRPAAKSFAPAPLRPSQSAFSFGSASDEDSFEEAPRPRPAPKISYARPAPVRPANTFSFDNEPKFSRPVPARQPSFSFDDEPRFAPQARPAPHFAPAPLPASRPAPRPVTSVRSSGGVLDQLAKDYALPSDGASPLHDISFGYY